MARPTYYKRFHPSQLQNSSTYLPIIRSGTTSMPTDHQGALVDSSQASIVQGVGQQCPLNSDNTDQKGGERVISAEFIGDRATTSRSGRTTAQADLAIIVAKEEFLAALQASLSSRESTIDKQETNLLVWESRLEELQKDLNKKKLDLIGREAKDKKRESDAANNELRLSVGAQQSTDSAIANSRTTEVRIMSLLERESQLSSQKKLAEEREKVIDDREQAVRAEEERITQRLLIWEENWKKLGTREKKIQSLEKNAQEYHRELEERENKVKEKEQELEALLGSGSTARQVIGLREQLAADENAICERNEKVTAREKLVIEREMKLQGKEDVVRMREDELSEQMERLGENMRALRQQEDEVKEKMRNGEENWKMLGQREEELNRMAKIHEEDRKILDQQKNKLEEQIKSCDANSKTVREQEERHMERLQKYNRNLQNLQEREKELESIAQENEKAIEQAYTSIANRERVLEERRAALELRMRQRESASTGGYPDRWEGGLPQGGLQQRAHNVNILKREQAVIKRESSVLKRETAVAARERAVAEREHMVNSDRERAIAEEREGIAIPYTSGRWLTHLRHPTSTLTDLEISTGGICTPATMSVHMCNNDEMSLQADPDIDVLEVGEGSF